ncbi:MAG: hypothetical protein HZY76_05385 [Anaerolineae bacterium]|nr:MAG: hypothetical protein HZY76_05385 [Anaerolineae bacterium]
MYEERWLKSGRRVTQMLDRVSRRLAQRYDGPLPGNSLADRVRSLAESLDARHIDRSASDR